MPKVKISEYSATANSNTDVASINIDEGCAPSGINNAIRAIMGHLKDFQSGTNGDPFNGPHNGTVGATTPSTGAFTTLSASGIITSTATAGQVVKAESGTTGILYSNFANTGGTFLYGIDNSAGTALFSGSAAYAGFIGTSGARPLVLATNGAGRAFIDSSGNMGIGTSSPAAKLHILDTAGGTTGTIRLGSATYYGTIQHEAGVTGALLYDVAAASGGGHQFRLGGTTLMNLNGSGNLGLGVTPSAWSFTGVSLDLAGNGSLFGGSTLRTAGVYLGSNVYYTASGDAFRYKVSSQEATLYESALGKHIWSTAASGTAGNPITFTQTMTLDASGNLLVGATTNTSGSKLILGGATNWGVGTQGGGNIFYIVRDSDGVGQYMVQGSTSWTSTSDERVKDIIEPITDAANKVSTLRAVIGKFKKDAEGTRRSFLIAQDVQAVLPEAVTIQEDEFGTLGVQYTEVIPLLVAAIKEQQALITQLTARITALEGA